ncbi:histidine phosphatase family protein [Phytoactinopolyspora alkaliphila]|uniref:Histidine phosphatase family protein n=1 Tax=Phytoactinopolyspora alkaliphila TaxID=1783498 RepID=A0A6N9YGD3_9ACTN|nr:histidine phosphatase family protein [Phytoactinopolyspora alkaliphila]NED93987.1 histidine phosphatase family protein [Phytoactinopolyspora alkaliphila]
MSRTLVLLRHAKSAWPDDVSDHERPLNKRGERDAASIGRWLRDRGLKPQRALVSSAQRTRATFDRVAAELEPPPELHVSDDAYAAGAGDLLDLVRETPDDVSQLLVIAHNPGIGTLASLIDDETSDVPERFQMRMDYRTSACAVFDVYCGWSELDPGRARLVTFTIPEA